MSRASRSAGRTAIGRTASGSVPTGRTGTGSSSHRPGNARRGGTAGAGDHTEDAAALRIDIHVRPMAAATAVGGVHDGALVVRVPAPAREGRATSAALEAVAEALGIAPSRVVLVRGATARRKLVEITGVDTTTADLRQRIERLRTM